MELLQCWDPLAWHAVIFIVQISANTYVYVCVHMSVTFSGSYLAGKGCMPG